MWLTEAQIQDLTRKKRPSAQIRVLIESGIPFRTVDGRPIVTASDINSGSAKKTVRRLTPLS